MAGAKSMIMSLWQVSDEATEIMMTAFYRNLSHGNSKKQAFNKAVAKVRKAYQKKYQKGKDSQKHRDIGSTARDDSSYYWAAFVLLD
jgi:CHAT domain-containing protein